MFRTLHKEIYGVDLVRHKGDSIEELDEDVTTLYLVGSQCSTETH